jgi:hypothetical protein
MSAGSLWMGAAPCSGHGLVTEQGLCLCDEAWDAGADLFELRVATTDAGQVLAVDCSVPLAGVRTAWAIFLFFCMYRFVFAYLSFARQVREQGVDVHSFMFRTLAFDLCVCTPLFTATALLRLTDSPQTPHVIGTDLATTLVFVTGTLATVSAWAMFEIHQFSLLCVGNNLGDHAGTKRGIERQSTTNYLLVASYGFLTILPTVVALGLDKAKGPVASGEFIIIIVRNVGVVVWQICALVGAILMQREISSLLTGKLTSSGPDTASRIGPGQQVQAVLDFLGAHTRSMAKKNALSLLVPPQPQPTRAQGAVLDVLPSVVVAVSDH